MSTQLDALPADADPEVRAALEHHLAQLPEILALAVKTPGSKLPAGERVNGVENASARAVSVPDLVTRLVAEHPELADGPLTALAGAARASSSRTRSRPPSRPARSSVPTGRSSPS